MNRGSAMKWVELLNACDWVYDPSQLKFESNGKKYGSAFGVLAEFLHNDDYKIAWDGISYLFDDEQFELSPNDRKRVKMKNDAHTELDLGGNIGKKTFFQLEMECVRFSEVAAFVEEHYAIL